MITALRSYEAAAAAVHSTDRTVELAVNEIAKV
jgi:flagellar basal body rod protein FlgG